MSEVFLFPEAGCIRGIPGIFAGEAVTVADDGTITSQPMVRHAHFTPSEEQSGEEREEEEVDQWH